MEANYLPRSFGTPFNGFMINIFCSLSYSLFTVTCSGRRETLIQNEVERLLIDEFVPKNNDIDIVYREALSDKSSSTLINALKTHVHEKIMQKGFGIAATNGTRADGRNLNAVRPISVTVPLFPDSVHGSSLFSRGETQVLSTATISAPKDGLPIMNPLSKSSWNEAEFNCSKDDENVPIGSLRFLRSQVELECKYGIAPSF